MQAKITLDFIRHDKAKETIQEILDKKSMCDENITNLNIWSEAGYVMYKLDFSDKSCFTVFDSGIIFDYFSPIFESDYDYVQYLLINK